MARPARASTAGPFGRCGRPHGLYGDRVGPVDSLQHVQVRGGRRARSGLGYRCVIGPRGRGIGDRKPLRQRYENTQHTGGHANGQQPYHRAWRTGFVSIFVC